MKKSAHPMTEVLTDEGLSRRLGQYQRAARIWLAIGLLGMAAGLAAAVAVQNAVLKTILVAVLFGGGLCCVLFLHTGAQEKQKALMQEQLGGFFRAELEKAFGPALHTAALCIDRPFLETLRLLDGHWEDCEAENPYEGSYHSLHFSAANVRLYHEYQRGTIREGKEAHRDLIFKGLAVRCETPYPAPSPFRAADRTAELPRHLAELTDTLAQRVEGRLSALCWEGRVLSLVLETDYGFAAVSSETDVRDLEAVRRSYCTSLREMCGLLDLLLTDTALFAERA